MRGRRWLPDWQVIKTVELELSWDSGSRKMKVSLDEELEALLQNQKHLALLVVERLVQIATDESAATPGVALRAIELLFSRVDGPVVQRHEINSAPMQRVILSSPAAAEGLAAARLGLLAVRSELENGHADSAS